MGVENGPNGSNSESEKRAPGKTSEEIADERAMLKGGNPGEAEERAEDSEEADALLGDDVNLSAEEIAKGYQENPPDFDIVQIDANGKKIQLPDGQRIIKLRDGQFGIFIVNRGETYVKMKTRIGNLYAKYGDEPFKKERVVSSDKLSKVFPEAFDIVQALSEKAKIKIPDSINPNQQIEVIRTAGQTGGRPIVKLIETGVYAIDHTARNSYLIEYDGRIIEYDAKTGKKYDSTSISDLRGPTKKAYDALREISKKA